ncbi:hypothetical protein IWQ60_000535 [Tieghemiomyces parasiticus]|uniref:Spp2/MOS2 G-patch domain-containing protein n=1 Tax=Tieghemiomyces parasiticus TaxID=78921 RepID=A0A9W8DXI1_9FUNG|nr:hypothetical protein IWQ60_000535 [Tieghemiomyces parasiticus]
MKKFKQNPSKVLKFSVGTAVVLKAPDASTTHETPSAAGSSSNTPLADAPRPKVSFGLASASSALVAPRLKPNSLKPGKPTLFDDTETVVSTERANPDVTFLTGVDERGQLELRDEPPEVAPLVIPLPKVQRIGPGMGRRRAANDMVDQISVDSAEVQTETTRESPAEEATLDDYSVLSKDDFADGLLRGMSWQDGESIGRLRKS